MEVVRMRRDRRPRRGREAILPLMGGYERGMVGMGLGEKKRESRSNSGKGWLREGLREVRRN